jgi:glycosyltransferase involved in cell wall biosynthesis
VIVADNGSNDHSKEIALNQGIGVRVIDVPERGYGAAHIAGMKEARGKYIIMGDSDGSHDFKNLMTFIDELRHGADLVVGDRFKGGIEKGAMSWLHKYIGNPVLSTLGRLFFQCKIRDWHCGLRGYNRDAVLKLGLKTTGMEFASEMIVKAVFGRLTIREVPIVMRKDGRNEPPHLRTWRDGWRHLKFLLMYSPDWLFLYPGLILFCIGLIGVILLIPGSFDVGILSVNTQTFIYMGMFILTGFNLMLFSIYSKVFALGHGYLPESLIHSFYKRINENLIIFTGFVLVLLGLLLSLAFIWIWKQTNYAVMDVSYSLRFTFLSTILIVMGIEMFSGGFLIGILKLK